MRIKRLEYHDRARGWKLEPVEFSNLNLLVGVSGAGKTQILNAILNLKKIANGESLNGVEWDIVFSGTEDKEYFWQGEFETKEDIFSAFADSKEDFKIIRERLFLNQSLIVNRDQNGTQFKDKPTPKLSLFQSTIEIFNQEDDIAPAKDSFKKVIEGSSMTLPSVWTTQIKKLLYQLSVFNNQLAERKSDTKKFNNGYSLQTILEDNIDIEDKLALIYIYFPDIFSKIKESFIDIFPQILDIKVELFEINVGSKISDKFSIIQIREKGVRDWIPEENISAGMYKTLLYIAEFYLSPKGSVILIDEFENSLGVNCIDAVTDILTERPDLQVIITSHHPYIINNIPMGCWKIVTRKGGVVTVKSAEDLHLGKSKHQAFTQLINKLEDYMEEDQTT
jgi:predicted ATPase